MPEVCKEPALTFLKGPTFWGAEPAFSGKIGEIWTYNVKKIIKSHLMKFLETKLKYF